MTSAVGQAALTRRVSVVGLDEDGGVRFAEPLGHGADPHIVAFDLGYVVVRAVEARRAADGVVSLSFLVRPRSYEQRPDQPGRGLDPGLALGEDAVVEVRQRLAAYALVTSELGLLATEFSHRTAAPGRWGPPGGGVEGHEQPTEALLREVAEETQQSVELGGLLRVLTSHWVGRSPRGTVEDFHAVRLLYTATCAHPTRPAVAELDGTTESARWVPLREWQSLPWSSVWHQVLTEWLLTT